MEFLDNVIAFLKSKFAYIYTAVSTAFTMVLSEIPDDEIADLHVAMQAGADALKAGKSPEEAFTEGLNALQVAERNTLTLLGTHLFNAFLVATAPKQTAAGT